MRLSYKTLSLLARSGDTEAMNILEQWDKYELPTQNSQAMAFFLLSPMNGPEGNLLLHTPTKEQRTKTLLDFPAPFISADVVILDNDGDTDGEE